MHDPAKSPVTTQPRSPPPVLPNLDEEKTLTGMKFMVVLGPPGAPVSDICKRLSHDQAFLEPNSIEQRHSTSRAATPFASARFTSLTTSTRVHRRGGRRDRHPDDVIHGAHWEWDRLYIEDEVRDADAVSIVEALRTAVSEDYVTKAFRNFLFEGFPRRGDHFAAFEERVSCVSLFFVLA